MGHQVETGSTPGNPNLQKSRIIYMKTLDADPARITKSRLVEKVAS